ncbi:MAG: hypothetical protein IPJ38_16850 [Dechloromonas sp.]|uniref:Uncharacterized protein n=1 Tax=Candidatus Dechloromonas phosphorivorans TaxID=2899244 RepID=A0A935K530_9RHOO|nr:hypothetical protein [Candidatus Dechloromonas phosphorivorans]
MAHIGQEGALGATGRLGGIPRLGQLGCARTDQRFKMMAVLLQLGFGLSVRGDICRNAAYGANFPSASRNGNRPET